MYVLCGNYGNETIAVVQWAKRNQLQNFYVVHIDTGWAATGWQARVDQGTALVEQCGFTSVALQSPMTMQQSVQDRHSFPNQKYQWCPIQLKGLALLDWLDEQDPDCEAEILLGKRRCQSIAPSLMQEYEAESELHGDRDIWYPLIDCENEAFFELIAQAGFDVLPHRSLECDPCIHNSTADFRRLADIDKQRLQQLEQSVGKTMFEKPIEQLVEEAKLSQDADGENINNMDMGCGSPYACGE